MSAFEEMTAYLGDTIPLSGYSCGTSDVYLLLTGPTLPVNGVALNDITVRADQGYFTKVSVDSNDTGNPPAVRTLLAIDLMQEPILLGGEPAT